MLRNKYPLSPLILGEKNLNNYISIEKKYDKNKKIYGGKSKSNKPPTFLLKSEFFNKDIIKKILIERGMVEASDDDKYVDFLYMDGKYFYKAKYIWAIQTNVKNMLTNEKYQITDKTNLYQNMKKKYPKIADKYMMKSININITEKIDKLKKLFIDNKIWNIKPQTGWHGIGQNIWMIKPAMGWHGIGQKVVNNYEECIQHIKKLPYILKENKYSKYITKKDWIVLDKYIDNPLLITKKKFHIRFHALFYNRNNIMRGFVFKNGHIIRAKKEFKLSDFYNKDIHDTHYIDGDELIFPDDFIKYFGKNKTDIVYLQLLDIIHYVLKLFTPNCYQETNYCYQVMGIDIMIKDNFDIILLELENKMGWGVSKDKYRLMEEYCRNIIEIVADDIYPPPSNVKILKNYTEITHKKNFMKGGKKIINKNLYTNNDQIIKQKNIFKLNSVITNKINVNRLPYKLKLIKKFKQHDLKIATKYYTYFIEKTYYFWNLFNNKTMYTYPYKLNTYEFIIPNHFYGFMHKNKSKNKSKNKINIKTLFDIDKKSDSIIKYRPYTSKFFQYNEIFYKYKIFEDYKKKTMNVLELTNYKALYFYEIYEYNKNKSNKNHKSNYDLFFFLHIVANSYDTPQTKLDALKYIKQKQNNINIFIINEFFNKYMIENNTTKYNLIICNIVYALRTLLRPHVNVQLYFNQYVFSLFNLEKDGNMIINIMQIITKPLADLIVMVSQFFKDTIIHYFEVTNKYNWSAVCIIHKKFRGITKQDKNKLLEMFDVLYKYDNTSMKYNILKNEDRKKFVITKKILPDFEYKYIDSFLNTKSSDKIYDKIREINTEIYIKKNIYMDRLIELKKMDKKEQELQLKKYRKEQVVNSIFYAKKYDFDYIHFTNKDIDNIIAKIVANDILSYHNTIIYKFNHDRNIKNTKLFDIFTNIKYKIDMIEWLLNKKNIDKKKLQYYTNKNKKYLINNLININTDNKLFKFYKPMNKLSNLDKKVKEKSGVNYVSNEFIIIYDIIDKFKLLPKKKYIKTFSISDSNIDDVKSINYYVKTKTLSELKWYSYTYGFSNITNKYSDYIFINNNTPSEMLNEKNIKFYNEYTKNVDLITSCINIDGLNKRDEIKFQYDQVVFILNNLPKKSNFIAKFVLPQFYPIQISMIYVLFNSFKELYFYKDNINVYSKNFYIIGKHYKGIKKKLSDKLFELLNKKIYFDNNIHLEKDLYRSNFIKQLEEIFNKLYNNYIFNIDRQLYYIDNYKYMTEKQIKLVNELIKEKNKDLIRNFNLKKINIKNTL